jgi:hypothetical protein
MIINRISARIGATAEATMEIPGSSGRISIGFADSSYEYNAASHFAFSRRLRAFSAIGDAHDLNCQTGATPTGDTYVAPVAQVETATCAGTITASGTATITVTSAGMTGSPLAINFLVTSGDTASAWAAKARTALNANATVKARFIIGGSGASVTLTRITGDGGYANDTTLNIATANGTCTGITAAPTSSNTTNGVLATGHIWERDAALDAEGVAFPTLSDEIAFLRVKSIEGSWNITPSGSEFSHRLLAGSDLVMASADSLYSSPSINFSPADNGRCELLLFVVMIRSVEI